MARCDVCGNDYEGTFQITRGTESGTYDSFECAVHAMAPRCAHCGCTIIGHGVQSGETIYCCAHCARSAGEQGLSDRADG